MADGRDVIAGLITMLNENKGKVVEALPANQEALEKIIDGYNAIQKKFFLKTEGGTRTSEENVDLFKELLAAIDAGGDAQAKFEAFAAPSNTLITTAANWVIRMT